MPEVRNMITSIQYRLTLHKFSIKIATFTQVASLCNTTFMSFLTFCNFSAYNIYTEPLETKKNNKIYMYIIN